MGGAAIPPGVIADAVAAAKGWLRAADTSDDAAIAGLCASAIETAEAFCGQVLVARAWTGAMPGDAIGWQALEVLPVMAITSLTDAAAVALPGGGYAIDIDADGRGWVRLTRAMGGVVSIGYAAGLAASWAELPPPIAQGIVMLVAHLNDQRDADVSPPAAVAALWRPWRRLTLSRAAHA